MVVREGMAEAVIYLTSETGVNRDDIIQKRKYKQKRGLWEMLTNLII